MYELYKPFRNYLRGFNMWSGFGLTYFYMQYLQFGKQLPDQLITPKIRMGASKMEVGIFEFIVETLTRELILNGQTHGGKPFSTANVAREAFNMIHKLEDSKWGGVDSNSDFILQQLSRIIFKQVPWQNPITNRSTARYYMLYSHPSVAPMLETEFGMTPVELFQVTMLLAEEMMHRPTPSFEFLQVADKSVREPVEALSERISRSPAELRKLAREHQSFDINWAYSFNPLREYPLVHAGNARSTMCPAPPILIQRLTDGLYFDLMRSDRQFGNAIGKAFEDYVGEAARSISDGHFDFLPEFRWGKPEKSSVDWIISDKSANLFVECKLARLNVAAQTEISPEPAFAAAIERLACNVGQLYATLVDSLAGQYPHWKPDGRPIHPVVVTFNNWFVFGPFFYKKLDQFVSEEFKRRGIDPSLLDQHPFAICSIDEFEALLTVCRTHSIHKVLTEKNALNHRQSLMQGFLAERHPGCFDSLKETFKNGTDAIVSGPSRLTGR
jgi:hypothetical protein